MNTISLKTLHIAARSYGQYCYALAFMLQSPSVLLLAAGATVIHALTHHQV